MLQLHIHATAAVVAAWVWEMHQGDGMITVSQRQLKRGSNPPGAGEVEEGPTQEQRAVQCRREPTGHHFKRDSCAHPFLKVRRTVCSTSGSSGVNSCLLRWVSGKAEVCT